MIATAVLNKPLATSDAVISLYDITGLPLKGFLKFPMSHHHTDGSWFTSKYQIHVQIQIESAILIGLHAKHSRIQMYMPLIVSKPLTHNKPQSPFLWSNFINHCNSVLALPSFRTIVTSSSKLLLNRMAYCVLQYWSRLFSLVMQNRNSFTVCQTYDD